MEIQLLRIDDRLIHGQVVIGWAKQLKTNRIILCDDEIAANEWEKELYLSCVPSDIESVVCNTKQTYELLIKDQHNFNRTIIVVKGPETIKALIDLGFKPDSVNVGGMHFMDERREFLPFVFLNDQEIESLKFLLDQNIEVYCQDLPGNKKHKIKELLG